MARLVQLFRDEPKGMSTAPRRPARLTGRMSRKPPLPGVDLPPPSTGRSLAPWTILPTDRIRAYYPQLHEGGRVTYYRRKGL